MFSGRDMSDNNEKHLYNTFDKGTCKIDSQFKTNSRFEDV